MAFLCPARTARKVKKKAIRPPLDPPSIPLGRITGSSSIDTLDRAGLERDDADNPSRKRVILHDFTPCNSGELGVRRNQFVQFLYQEHNWHYVKDSDGNEGFVPKDICGPVGTSMDDLTFGRTNGNGPNVSIQRNKNYNSIRSAPAMPYTRLKSSDKLEYAQYQNQVTTPDIIQHVRRRTALAQTPTEREAQKQQTHSIDLGPYKANNHNNGYHDAHQAYNYNPNNNLQGYPKIPFAHQDNHLNTSPPKNVSSYEKSNNKLSVSIHSQSSRNSSSSHDASYPILEGEQKLFLRSPQGKYFVKFDFRAISENDVSVRRGHFVTLLNKEDPAWYWVLTDSRQEGFVPSNFLIPAYSPIDPVVGHMNISCIPSSPEKQHVLPLETPRFDVSGRKSKYGDLHSTPNPNSTYHHKIVPNNSSSELPIQSEVGADFGNMTFPNPEKDSRLQHRFHQKREKEYIDMSQYHSQLNQCSQINQGQYWDTVRTERDVKSECGESRHKNTHNKRKDAQYRSTEHVRARDPSSSPTRRRQVSSESDYNTRDRKSRYEQMHNRIKPNGNDEQEFIHGRSISSNRYPDKNFMERRQMWSSSENVNSSGTYNNGIIGFRPIASKPHVTRSRSTDTLDSFRSFANNPHKQDQNKQKESQTNNSRSHNKPEIPREIHSGWPQMSVIKDFHSNYADTINVQQGDLILMDPRRSQEHWIWCWSVKNRKYGFIPKSHTTAALSTAL